MDITVLTYNIEHGLYYDILHQTLSNIAADGIDICCLQEVNHVRDPKITKYLVEQCFSKWERTYFNDPRFGIYLGFATLWNPRKCTLIDTHQILLSGYNGKTKLHHKLIMSPKKSKTMLHRAALITTFQLKNGKMLRVSNIHLEWQGGDINRVRQLRYLKEFLSALPQVDYDVVCGDYNSIGPSTIFGKDLFRKRQDVIGQALGTDFANTLPDEEWTHDGLAAIDSKMPFYHIKRAFQEFHLHYYQKLDHIFVRGAKVLDAKKLKMEGSDHYPLVTTLDC